MSFRRLLLSASLLTLAAGGGAYAEEQVADQVDTVLVLARDKAGLLEKQPSNTVFGLDKPLIETPRSASLVSDLTLERFGIETLDGVSAVSPGTHTASFYGVAGALNIRGTLAENYFRGFKRVENRGTYSTPIGGAARIEILRGPPTPVYGAGKVGGLVNFIPKSARDEGRFLAEPEGQVTATFGSYNKKLLTGQFGAPLSLGAAEGGVYVYGEVEDSHSYYRGIYPRHQTLELSADFDLGNGWSTAFGGMAFHSDGDVQTPGWNRLTQDLIDNRNYITGRDTTLKDADGNGRLTPNEVGFYPYASALYLPYYGFPTSDGLHTLDTGLGTTKLNRHTVYISPADFSKTTTGTLYFDLAKDLGGDRILKLQLFHDTQDNERFVSYGYPSAVDAKVSEARITLALPTTMGAVSAKTLVGASHRRFEGRRRESYNSGLIALDRRDIAFGATPTDTIDSPFSSEAGDIGLKWENDNRSKWSQSGVFFTSDIEAGRWNLILGGRYDHYDVESEDTGFLSYTIAGRQSDDRDKATYNASLTYKAPVRPDALHLLRQGLCAGDEPGRRHRAIARGRRLVAVELGSCRDRREIPAVGRDPGRLAGRLSPEPHPVEHHGLAACRAGDAGQGRRAGGPVVGFGATELHLHRQQPAHHNQGAGRLVPIYPGLYGGRGGRERLRRLLRGLELRGVTGAGRGLCLHPDPQIGGQPVRRLYQQGI
jgi:iron complex outermembrane receptor protein